MHSSSVHQAVFSPKGGRGGAPPPFLVYYPLMWSLECIKFFDLFIPPPVSFGGEHCIKSLRSAVDTSTKYHSENRIKSDFEE